MYYLHTSNRTENLLHHLSEVILLDREPSLFARELFLIQSQGMERMISQSLADRFSSFCNFGFFLPLEFLGFIAEKLDLAITPDGYQRHILTWRLDELLRDISKECYQGLRYYLSGENSNVKRFQLARQLANVFDQYQVMRSDMLVAWEEGKSAVKHPDEEWQADIWRRLVAQPGAEIHRGIQFRRLIDTLNSQDTFSCLLPKRISVIGLHIMPPIFLEFLMSLSRHLDVHLLVLSPCRHYWGDLANKRKLLKEDLRQEVAREKETMLVEDTHPLLEVLGRQGRDFQKMMLANVDFQMEFESFVDPIESESSEQATLLQRLQSDLLDGQMRTKGALQDETRDDSIQVVSCHSRLRELGVLKDHILRFLDTNADLGLRDIIVMAPDIQEYAPLIPALFNDVQHSIADRSLQKSNAMLGAFLDFFQLFRSRFGWSEILDVLRQPVIYPNFQLTANDIDTVQHWIVASGIRWGLSGAQRAETGFPPFAETSWRTGLDRLLMGYAIDSDSFVNDTLPFPDIEGRGALPLGGLCQFIELLERAYHDFKKEHSLEQWSMLLLDYVEQLLGAGDDRDLLGLRSMISDLGQSNSGFHTQKVSFDVLYEWFEQSASESRSSSGFLRGQLTFCSMLPMRSIPFKIVCLLGLDDGVFPKRDNHATFDIMGEESRWGDRSPRSDDRYQFLEAILAARSSLYLSYIGSSIRTNEKIPPSVVITEFLETLEKGYGITDMVVHHPLHPFSSKYFASDKVSSLFSYDQHYCQTANALQQPPLPEKRWWRGRLTHEISTIFFADLLRYFTNPQRWFVRDCLDIRLDSDEQFPEDNECFQAVGLDKYYVEQDLIAWELSGRPDNILKKLQLEGKWALGRSGIISFERSLADLAPLIEKIRAEDMGKPLADLPLDLDLGKYHLSGTVSSVYEEGVLLFRNGALRGRELLTGWLHQLALEQILPVAVTRVITRDDSLIFRTTDGGPQFETLLDHFVKGCLEPSSFFVEPAFSYVRQMKSSSVQLTPLTKAIKTWEKSLKLGYEPEWNLLYGNSQDPAQILNKEFEQQCQTILAAIWSRGDEE